MDDRYGWMQAWVSVTKANADGTLNSLTIGIEANECHIEVGERKDPLKSLIDTDNQSWWSPDKVMTKKINSNDLKKESVTEFANKASQELGIQL